MTDKEKIAKVMELAFSYVGTKEEPPNSNNVCFNTRYYGREVSGSNYPWCMAFLWSLFDEAGLSKEFGKKTASCTTFRDSNKDKIITKGFKRGDIFCIISTARVLTRLRLLAITVVSVCLLPLPQLRPSRVTLLWSPMTMAVVS